MGWLGISGSADHKIGKANHRRAARTTFRVRDLTGHRVITSAEILTVQATWLS